MQTGHDLAAIARDAIAKAGGGADLARALKVSRASVQKWKTTRIPAERVPEVASITGLAPHQLRPDLKWPAVAAAEAA